MTVQVSFELFEFLLVFINFIKLSSLLLLNCLSKMLLIIVEILFRGFTRKPCSITAIFFHKFRSYAPKNRLNVNLITITNLVYRSILL